MYHCTICHQTHSNKNSCSGNKTECSLGCPNTEVPKYFEDLEKRVEKIETKMKEGCYVQTETNYMATLPVNNPCHCKDLEKRVEMLEMIETFGSSPFRPVSRGLGKDFEEDTTFQIGERVVPLSDDSKTYKVILNGNFVIQYLDDDGSLILSPTSYFRKLRKPKEGEVYWFVSTDGEMGTNRWYDDKYDNDFWNFGNVFETKEQAEHYRDRIKKFI